MVICVYMYRKFFYSVSYYPRRLCRSACVGRLRPSICLSIFVRSITHKRMIPTCSNLVWGLILGYSRSFIFLIEKSKVKIRGSETHNTSFQTTIALHSHSLGGDNDKSNTACGFELSEYILVLYFYFIMYNFTAVVRIVFAQVICQL